MADFQFTIDDLLDFSEGDGVSSTTESAMLREFGRNYSGELQSTASTTGSNSFFSTLSLGQVLMGQVLIKDPAVALNRHEYLTSALLGGSLTSEDNPAGSLGGIFDNMIPNDIKSYIARRRAELGTDTNTPGQADGTSGPTGAYNTESYVFMAEQLISHPNFRLQNDIDKSTGDYGRTLRDLRDGLINPWLIATLKILCDNFALYVGGFGATTTTGHIANSQHYVGNAVDISRVGPPNVPYNQGADEVEDDTPMVQSVLACLNSIHAPWRPSTVICAAFPAFGGGQAVTIEGTRFTANADHGLGSAGNGHFHIDCKTRPAPEDIPPPGRGRSMSGVTTDTTTRTGTSVAIRTI